MATPSAKPASKPATTTATQPADAAQTWADAFMGDVQAATKLTFDVAADLLSAQREFAVELTKVLLPAKSA